MDHRQMRNSIARMNYLNSSQPSTKHINDVKHQVIAGILTSKRQGQNTAFQPSSQVARKHEKIIFLRNNIVSEWQTKKQSRDYYANKFLRNQKYTNTLNPREYPTENMIDAAHLEMADGRLTADVNEVYPEGGTIVNSSLNDSWVNYRGHHSPFVNSAVKRKKTGTYDSKSKISSYRQRYYDKVYNTNDGSFIDDKIAELTVTTGNTAYHTRTSKLPRKGTK